MFLLDGRISDAMNADPRRQPDATAAIGPPPADAVG